jgi:MarR family transcriptional regulator, transcriptional regulator for hemolysin
MTSSRNPAPTSRATALPGDLGWNLGMVLRGYQTRLEEAVNGMPGGVRGYQVLSTVAHRDPANQQALAAHLVIDRTVLTYLLDTLAEAEVVERVSDPADRRARKIVATSHGRKLLERYEARVAAAEAELLSGLDTDDAGQLARLLSGLAMNVHRAQPNSSPCEAMDYLP